MNPSSSPELDAIFARYSEGEAASQLRTEIRAQVVRWRWASKSMGFDVPFARQLYGGSAPRWLSDAHANPGEHVHHGLDAQGRIVMECSAGESEQLYLHTPGQRVTLDWRGNGGLQSAGLCLYQDGKPVADHLHLGYRGIDTLYEYDGDRLLRSVMRNWAENQKPWFCQYAFHYGADGGLERIDLQYLDAQGRIQAGADRLHYLRLPKGETLKTVEARVQSLLEPALAAALVHIPHDEPLYCLLLCYTHEDLPAAWPPFLVWGRESYRRRVLERAEDIHYYLWAPDEIRDEGAAVEYWPKDQALRDACLLHSQLMGMRNSDSSALRVLKHLLPLLESKVKQSGLPITDDFVVAMADNTNEINPLKAMKARLPADHWQLLKQRGYV